ncbi:MAG TPA: septal ring lytic transglycosylase RlpA family protein [Casimicrobiaceae bacterium]|nr:septal ring lytic transglycosylase RlpA family protein [Casimicrobiaceae bacterium]
MGPPPPTTPPAQAGSAFRQRGKVSLYGDGDGFDGKKTASGEMFDAQALTMAHPSLPFGTRVRVTNLENQRSVEVVVNDRGPAIRGRIADVSLAAARALGMLKDGVIDALLEVVGKAPSSKSDAAAK